MIQQNPVSASPLPSGTNSPAPKKSTGSVDYLALDFQPSSPSPHRKVPGGDVRGGSEFSGLWWRAPSFCLLYLTVLSSGSYKVPVHHHPSVVHRRPGSEGLPQPGPPLAMQMGRGEHTC